MKTHAIANKPAQPAGGRLFAAVCVAAIAAFGAIACSGRSASTIVPAPHSSASAPSSWPTPGADPSLPSASEALAGRLFDPVEPAPTF